MFKPENRLEELLMSAAKDPGRRPEFYRAFLESDLLAMGKVAGPPEVQREGPHIAGQDTRLELASYNVQGEKLIPIFSSLVRLRESVKAETGYLQIKARTLFESVRPGTKFVLNPHSAYGKEFSGDEIRALLDGSLFSVPPTQTIPGGQKIQFQSVKDPPEKLISSLTSLFQSSGIVKRAYVVQIFVESSGEPAHLAVAVELAAKTSPAFEGLMREAGLVTRQVLEQREIVDFLEVRTRNISEAVEKVAKPFFEG